MRTLLLAALIGTALAAAPARAADPAAFNAVASEMPVPQPDKYDERAVLAALLARPDVAAEFDADAKAALSDPQLKTLLVAKWRGKTAAYATTQVNRPGIDYAKSYHNWKEVLGPEGYAYTRQRLLSMSKANADQLIGYLGALDQKLQANNFKVDDSFFSMANKIVNGILDAYRKDLGQYLATPAAQSARAAVAAATQQLAAAIQAKQAASAPSSQPAAPVTQPSTQPATPPAGQPPAKPAAEPAPGRKPKIPVNPAPKPKPAPAASTDEPPAGAVTGAQPSRTAKEQADAARRAGNTAGTVFDGGAGSGVPAAPPVSEGGETARPSLPPSGLSPAAPAGPVVGAVPEPPSALDDLDARVAQAGASGKRPWAGKVGLLAAGGGALLGGLVGFLLGGPIGMLVGAAVGGLVAHVAANRLLK